jgi:hypothetical protein
MRWLMVIGIYLTKVCLEIVDRIQLARRRRRMEKHRAESRAKRRERRLAAKQSRTYLKIDFSLRGSDFSTA